MTMADVEALEKAGQGDKPLEAFEVECKFCAGTGRRIWMEKQ